MHFDYYSIRFLELADTEAYFKLIDTNRNRLVDYFAGTVSRTHTLEATREFIVERIKKRDEKIYLPYVIVDDETKDIIGFIDIKNIDWRVPKGELGCYLDARYAGKGIAKKAFNLFIDYCFEELKFNKLFLRTHETNTPARKLAEQCGFEVEGKIRKDHITTAGQIIDLLYYGKIKS